MDDELNILRLFSENGFNKIIEKFDELLNNQDLFINFIIKNLKTKENIKILCNFIKLDVLKYELLINKILKNDVVSFYVKKMFVINLFNINNLDNLKILNNEIYELIIEDININNIETTILYKIFDNNIIERKDERLDYYYNLFDDIINKHENMFLEWLFKLLNFYNY